MQKLNDAWELNSVQLKEYIGVGWIFDVCPFK